MIIWTSYEDFINVLSYNHWGEEFCESKKSVSLPRGFNSGAKMFNFFNHRAQIKVITIKKKEQSQNKLLLFPLFKFKLPNNGFGSSLEFL